VQYCVVGGSCSNKYPFVYSINCSYTCSQCDLILNQLLSIVVCTRISLCTEVGMLNNLFLLFCASLFAHVDSFAFLIHPVESLFQPCTRYASRNGLGISRNCRVWFCGHPVGYAASARVYNRSLYILAFTALQGVNNRASC